MPGLVIFYAWQSDTGATTKDRNFIKDAAKKAAGRYQASSKLVERPAIDSDTSGVSGTPAIADTILEKIAVADLFLYDATIVHRKHGRASPNPNVLIELGFAVGKLGWPLIIGVMNEAHGGFEDLPFDLRHRRRPIAYSLHANATPAAKKAAKATLADDLEGAFRLGHEARLASLRHTPLDRLVAHRVRDAATAGVQHMARLAVHVGMDHSMLSRFSLLLMGAPAVHWQLLGANVSPIPSDAEIVSFVDALLTGGNDHDAEGITSGYPRFIDAVAGGMQDAAEDARIALRDLGTQARPELALPLARLILLQKEGQTLAMLSQPDPLVVLGDSPRICLVRIVRTMLDIQAAWTDVLAW